MFPDAGIGRAGDGDRFTRKPLKQIEVRPRAFGAEALVEINGGERKHHLTENIVLGLSRRGVADAHGAVPVEARPLVEYVFIEIGRAVQAIEGREHQVRVAAGEVQQKPDEVLAFLEVTENPEGLERVVGVAQPAIAVIPGAPAPRGFGDRGRHGRHDRTRILEAVQLERQGRANDFPLEHRRDVAMLDPAPPVAHRFLKEALAQPRQRLLDGCAPGEHKMSPFRERKRLPSEVSQRNVGGEPQGAPEAFVLNVIRSVQRVWDPLRPAQAWLARHAHERCARERLEDAAKLRRAEASFVLREARRKIGHSKHAVGGGDCCFQDVGVFGVALRAGRAVRRTGREAAAVPFVEQG